MKKRNIKGKDLTCYGLEYCCSLKKPCEERDQTLRNFGISQKKYLQLKNECKSRFRWNQK